MIKTILDGKGFVLPALTEIEANVSSIERGAENFTLVGKGWTLLGVNESQLGIKTTLNSLVPEAGLRFHYGPVLYI